MTSRKQFEDTVNQVTKELIDQGKLIEAGFSMFRRSFLHDASDDQIADMKFAFMSGAQHVFGSIMAMLDPGDEPTDADMRRLDQISDEMDAWVKKFASRGYRTKGSA